MLRVVATCWKLLDEVLPVSNFIQQLPTSRNNTQHVGPNNVASVCMGLYSSKFSFDISISASTRNTKTFVLLVLTLSACANTCALDAPTTVVLMLMLTLMS